MPVFFIRIFQDQAMANWAGKRYAWNLKAGGCTFNIDWTGFIGQDWIGIAGRQRALARSRSDIQQTGRCGGGKKTVKPVIRLQTRALSKSAANFSGIKLPEAVAIPT